MPAGISRKPITMYRRTILTSLCMSVLTACASRPPKPPLKPNELRRIGMLPIKQWPDSGGSGQFKRSSNSVLRDGYVPPPITPNMLGMAIGNALRNSKNADLRALSDAVVSTQFDPESTLHRTVQNEFSRRSVQIAAIGDLELAEQIHNSFLKGMPTDVDAILDIEILGTGYYAAGGARGYTPSFQISVRIIDAINQGEIVDEFTYEGDDRQSRGDSRYFTTPAGLSQSNLGSFLDNAEYIRAGMTAVFERVAEKLVDDIARVRQRLPRVDK